MSVKTRSRSDRVFLTGFMGNGKSTIGPILANTIGYEFVDVDRAIERFVRKTVNEIFHEHGEEYFRTLERNLIADLCARKNIVVALGGGTIADPVSYKAVTASGVLVYLKIPPQQIITRLRSKTDRPLLTGASGEILDEESVRSRAMSLYLAREPFYEKADITVLSGEQSVGLTVDEIVRKLSNVR